MLGAVLLQAACGRTAVQGVEPCARRVMVPCHVALPLPPHRQQSAAWVRGETSSQQYHEAVAELGLVRCGRAVMWGVL